MTKQSSGEKPKYFKSQSDLNRWFQKNHNKLTEQWIGFYKKDTGKKSITYPEALDDALCFGWIDGRRKKHDEESYKIRFTPRREKSIWSQVNIKRIKELIKLDLVQPPGLQVFKKRDKKKVNKYSFEQGTVKFPPAYEKKFKANKKAWTFFSKQAPYYRRIATWWVISAKREETQQRRLDTLIYESENSRKPGVFHMDGKAK